MIYEEKEFTLRDGTSCTLKSPSKENAAELIDYMRRTAGESDFLVRYPEEVVFSVEQEEAFLSRYANNALDIMICASVDGKIVANIGVGCVGDNIKARHRATLGVAVFKEYHNRGIATLLINEAISEAKKLGYSQLELNVMNKNEKALRLYERLGFVRCGEIPDAFRLKDGTSMSEITMTLRL